ncbi:MAG TPA: acetate/propionate family kinase [Candidatus Polarisedimenticolia bacterium]|jgi:acetate kinase|nr:acetate/propionate family kinase [Candidatus Polarisedimenticolia bacterium]
MGPMILSLNGGSSSLKFAVYRLSDAAEERVFSGAVEAIGEASGKAWLRGGDEILSEESGTFPDHTAAIKTMFAALQKQGAEKLAAAGHRIVHGGPKFTSPQLIDEKMKEALKDLVPFAPLHLPSQVAMIKAVAAHFPELPQVACFDTAFHSRMPEVAQRFALPRVLWEQGIKRYGFHGLSYEYVVGKLGRQLGRRAIIAHLGNGASMVALKDCVPMDTSMGLTPTGGFMMGTRSGDLDPGILIHLMKGGYTADQLETLVDRQAGLLGVSGQTSDMKVLLQQTDPAAMLAVQMFTYQVRKFIGAFAAVLNGLDTLVFTGGIGERAALVRANICTGLEYLGVVLDTSANGRNAEVISLPACQCTVRVIQTDEDLMIARHTRNAALSGQRNPI